MLSLLRSVAFTFRLIRQRPGFVVVLLSALTLGIGLTTAIFSVFYGVLLKPLPFRAPGELVEVMEKLPRILPTPINMPAWQAIELSKNPEFSGSAIFVSSPRNGLEGDRAERIDCLRAAPGLLDVLGVSLLRGRNFTATEDANGSRVAIVAESLENERFSGNALGKTIVIEGASYDIVGVLPRSVVFPLHGMMQSGDTARVWIPLSLTPAERAPSSADYKFSLIARLRPNADAQAAQQAAGTSVDAILSYLPASVRKRVDLQAAVLPLRELVIGDSKRLMVLLLTAVGALLLVCCTNVSSMLLSWAVARRRELALRTALGANTSTIVGQLLSENLFFFVSGGILGAVTAVVAERALIRLLPPNLPRIEEIGINGPVVVFAIGVMFLTGLIFGLLPALSSLKMDVADTLSEGSRSQSAGRTVGRARRVLLVTQLALAFVLLVGAGLLIRSFFAVLNQQHELESDGVLTFRIALPVQQYSNDAVDAFYIELARRLGRLPSTTATGYGTDIPFEASSGRLITPDHPASGASPIVDNTSVAGAYFDAIGAHLKSGRLFDDHDVKGSEPVAVVNNTLAHAFWPNESALNRRLKFGLAQSRAPWLRIVGVVNDPNGRGPDKPAQPRVYVPLEQEANAQAKRQVWYLVVTHGNALALSHAVQDTVHSMDAGLPVEKLRTMDQVLSTAMAPRTANTRLLTVFAAAALLLTAIGVYGLMAHSIAERTREIGIRMALGASRSDIFTSVAREAGALCLISLMIAIPVALFTARLLKGLVFGVSTHDVATLAVVTLTIVATVLVALVGPLWRALHLDPQAALHHQ